MALLDGLTSIVQSAVDAILSDAKRLFDWSSDSLKKIWAFFLLFSSLAGAYLGAFKLAVAQVKAAFGDTLAIPDLSSSWTSLQPFLDLANYWIPLDLFMHLLTAFLLLWLSLTLSKIGLKWWLVIAGVLFTSK